MTAEEKKTIDMIRQIREAVENQSLPLEQFPLEDLVNLVDVTLGIQIIKKMGGMKKQHFESLTRGLLKNIQNCVQKKDIESCVDALMLLEEQYRCFDVILTACNSQKHVEQYKIMTIVAGEAYSKQQFYRHQMNSVEEAKNENCIGMGKGVVYTCTFLSQIELQQPEYINMNWDYVCFTNDNTKWGTKEGVWEYRKIDVEDAGDLKTLFNMCMIKPHVLLPEYDYSIWVNPAYKIVGDLELLQAGYGRNASCLAFPTYVCDDVYEIISTTGLGADDENIRMRKKKLQYEKEGYPQHYGMISGNILFRSHRDETLCKVMETWWQEAMQCGRLWDYGFNYAAWKHNYDYALCDLFVETNEYFKNMVCDLEVRGND